MTTTDFKLPNVRKLFIPDKGYVIFDADLKGADAQVFARETGDEQLLKDFREDRDIHSDNAEFMFGSKFDRTKLHLHEHYHMRQRCKHSVHATHNVGSERALMLHPSIAFSRAEAIRFQKNWFSKHPRIPEYFESTQRQLEKTRSVSNRFGYRIIYFDRIEQLLPQAIPWINQSTVAIVTFKGALKIRKELPWVEMLLQVHDSLVFQVPIHLADKTELIRKTLEIPIPYPNDEFIIPWGLARSEKSWGDCEKVEETK